MIIPYIPIGILIIFMVIIIVACIIDAINDNGVGFW
jgi:hypothetical protein